MTENEEEPQSFTMREIYAAIDERQTDVMELNHRIVNTQRQLAHDCLSLAVAYREQAQRMDEAAQLHGLAARKAAELTGDALSTEFELSMEEILKYDGIDLEADDDGSDG